MPFKWVVIAVSAEEAQESGTGQYEPFAAVREDEQELILCKAFVEIPGDKASERDSD